MHCDLAVIIPAKNEEDRISACLGSVLRALDACGQHGCVVVAADNCDDLTVARARTALGGRGLVLEGSFGSPGAARRAATTLAINEFRPQWLANTDADTMVAADWLRHQSVHERQGYDMVAGTVAVDDFDGRAPELPARFRTFYEWHAANHEPHIHGANLSFSTQAYRRSPGWEPMEAGEDRHLWSAFGDEGARRLACPELVVTTSGRRDARAKGGFADFLTAMEAGLAG